MSKSSKVIELKSHSKDSHDQTQSENNLALSLLALHLQPEPSGQAEMPGNEALIEYIQGTCSQAQRRHIEHCLAHNPLAYERWLALAQAIETSPEQEITPQNQAIEHGNLSVFKGIAIPGRRSWWSAASLAFAACLVYFLVIPLMPFHALQPDLNQEIDLLYNSVGKELTPISTQSLRLQGYSKSLSSDKARTLSDEALIHGLSEGLKTLGHQFSIPGIQINNSFELASELSPTDEQDIFFQAGRLITLHYFTCRNPAVSNRAEYLEKTKIATQKVITLLSQSKIDHSLTRFARANQYEPIQNQTCGLVDLAITLIKNYQNSMKNKS